MSNYWLLKSEPEVFSIQALEKAKGKTTHWDGVRNYQARNFMRDTMKVGDQAFFYHSNAEPSAIAGIVEIVKAGYPDHTAFDPQDPHYDPKSKKRPTYLVHGRCAPCKNIQKATGPRAIENHTRSGKHGLTAKGQPSFCSAGEQQRMGNHLQTS